MRSEVPESAEDVEEQDEGSDDFQNKVSYVCDHVHDIDQCAVSFIGAIFCDSLKEWSNLCFRTRRIFAVVARISGGCKRRREKKEEQQENGNNFFSHKKSFEIRITD